MTIKIRPVILSGGKGSRLWPLSRDLYPKQFLDFFQTGTLFQETLERVKKLEIEAEILSPCIVCNADHRFLVAEQARFLNGDCQIILEPVGRNTAPGIAAAAFLQEDPATILLVLPADHIIENNNLFSQAVMKACTLAKEEYLVTFGIVPTAPETGYGYLQKGKAVGEGFLVENFVEKPDEKTAKEYIKDGSYLWNSGMFVFQTKNYLAELEKYAKDIYSGTKEAVKNSFKDLDFIRLEEKSFEKTPSDSIDYAVMEKTEKCAMVAFDAPWNDLGSFGALFEVAEKDAQNNVCFGDVIHDETKNCYIYAENRLVTTTGVENLVIIETADSLLVANKDKTQDVKNIYNKLLHLNRSEIINHRKVFRPWGSFESLEQSARFQVKRILVNPGGCLSLQKHYHRAEHWIIVQGTAKVQLGENEILLSEDQSTYIPVGMVHRLENPGKIPLELIEVQTGAYLGEDDIVRLEDVYHRESK